KVSEIRPCTGTFLQWVEGTFRQSGRDRYLRRFLVRATSSRGDRSGRVRLTLMKQSRPITLLDVARAAGVSKTTVSDALSGRGRLPAATRERVSAVARELGYVANRSARNLRG